MNAKSSAALVAAVSLLLAGCDGPAPPNTTKQADGTRLADASLPSLVLNANSVDRETVLVKGELQNIYLVPAQEWTNWLARFPNTHPGERIVDSQVGGQVKVDRDRGAYSMISSFVVVAERGR